MPFFLQSLGCGFGHAFSAQNSLTKKGGYKGLGYFGAEGSVWPAFKEPPESKEPRNRNPPCETCRNPKRTWNPKIRSPQPPPKQNPGVLRKEPPPFGPKLSLGLGEGGAGLGRELRGGWAKCRRCEGMVTTCLLDSVTVQAYPHTNIPYSRQMHRS